MALGGVALALMPYVPGIPAKIALAMIGIGALAPSPSAACAVTACGSAHLLGISIRRRRSKSRPQRYPNVKQGIICRVFALAIILNKKLGSYDDVVGYEVAASVAKGERFLSVHRRYLGLNGLPRHRSRFIHKIIQ